MRELRWGEEGGNGGNGGIGRAYDFFFFAGAAIVSKGDAGIVGGGMATLNACAVVKRHRFGTLKLTATVEVDPRGCH